MSHMGHHKSIKQNDIAKVAIENYRQSGGQADSERNQRAWRQRQARNYWAIYITIFCMSLEIPFKRYIFREPLSLLLARLRFLGVAWICLRLALFVALGDCEYALLRAYLYDWTVYYPSDRRANVQKIFIGGLIYNLCLKVSMFHHRSISFDPSLIDYLCSKPPPESPSHHAPGLDGGENSSIINNMQYRGVPLSGAKPLSDQARRARRRRTITNTSSNFLRDRSHWFELSDLVWKVFKTNAMVVLVLCAFIMTSANIRLGLVYKSPSRECDYEMPLLRLLGLFELNFLLIECTYTLIGSFSYCSMVKSDLMVQAQRVESYLISLIRDIKLKTNLVDQMMPPQPSTRLTEERPSILQPALSKQSNLTRRLASISLPYDNMPLSGALHSNKVHELIRKPESSVRKTFNAPHKLKFLPLELASRGIECPRLYASSRHLSIQNTSQFFIRSQMREPDGADTMLLDSMREFPESQQEEKLAICRRLTDGIVEAQDKVILFLRCIDSYKPAISFVGNSFLLWMLTSISFAPMLIASLRATPSERLRDISFGLSCMIALSTGLFFTYIGATIHNRAVRLTSLLFRICSLYHSQAVAVRWNKIFMIWYCPSRCAFKVMGIFKLTHLNMLKAVSFLGSALTLVLNYIG